MPVVELNGRQVDLSAVFPLRIKDWHALEARGVSQDSLTLRPVTALAEIAFYALSKADSTVTREEIGDLTLDHPVILAIGKAVRGTEADTPRPF